MLKLKEKLKELMVANDLSLKELSLRSGVPLQTLHNWISGQMPRNILQLKKVAVYFKITLDDLVFEEVKRVNINNVKGIPDGEYELVLRPVRRVSN